MDFALRLFSDHLTDRRRSERTSTRYHRVLLEFAQHLDRSFGQRGWTLDDVDKDCLVRFLRNEGVDGRSASTSNVRLAALRTFFGFLVSQGMVARNPAAAIEFVPVRSKEPVFLSIREYQRLLRAVSRTGFASLVARDEAILVVLFNTGLRVSELTSLTLDMLDFGTRAFRSVPLKGGQFGSSEWNHETERVVDAWLRVRRTWCVADRVRALFVTMSGRPLSVRAVQDLVARYGRKARLKKRVTPHVLRHSMATELLQQGFDIRVIAGLLHHASLNTTKRYAHLVDSVRGKALASLEPKRTRGRSRG